MLGLPLILSTVSPVLAAPAENLALQTPQQLQDSAALTTFADAISAHIAQAQATAQPPQKDWLAQLRSFYLSRGGAPVWVAANGWSDRAVKALDVLAQADAWGLDAQDYPQPLLPEAANVLERAEAEVALSLAVVRYAHDARGGRIDPSSLSLWLDKAAEPVFATTVMIDIISSDDMAAVMRDMHPPHPQFERLRLAYAAMRHEIDNPKQLAPEDRLTASETLKLGASHPDVATIRRRLNIPAVAGLEDKFDEKLANKLNDYLDARDVRVRWGRIDDKVRSHFNRAPPPPSKDDLARVLANMERWRWLPRNLGAMHIWNNIPEYLTRVVKDGELVHEARIIVGEAGTQTPVFSDMMRQLVFQPEWGVPPSIKVRDLLPKLQGGDYAVLERRGMRILGLSGKQLRPQRFNWSKVDIRDVGIYQRSGGGNPLGRVKFLFPNKHHVYMHDTNNRALFTAKNRTFSHGCVRVNDPERLAKLILGLDKGWAEADVERLLKDYKKPNNKVDLDRPFPVHNVYFTMLPDENNTIVKLPDIYGHDKRVIAALSGVPAKKIAASDPARNQLREMDEAAPQRVRNALRKSRTARSSD